MTTPSTARSSVSPSDSLQRSSATSYPYAQRKHLPCASPKVSCSDAQPAAAPNSRSSTTTKPKSSACSPPATPPVKSAGTSKFLRTPGTGTGNNETLTFVRDSVLRQTIAPKCTSHKNRLKRGRDRVRTPGRPQKPPETWTGRRMKDVNCIANNGRLLRQEIRYRFTTITLLQERVHLRCTLTIERSLKVLRHGRL